MYCKLVRIMVNTSCRGGFSHFSIWDALFIEREREREREREIDREKKREREKERER